MMTYDTLQTVVLLSNLIWWFINFVLAIVAIAMAIGIIELIRIVTRRVTLDVVEMIVRYRNVSLDISERCLKQEGARLAIEQQRKALRGTPTAWDIEIEKIE